MTVVKRTNRCATVAFGCDRSTRARRTNERPKTTRMQMHLDWDRFSTRARETWGRRGTTMMRARVGKNKD